MVKIDVDHLCLNNEEDEPIRLQTFDTSTQQTETTTAAYPVKLVICFREKMTDSYTVTFFFLDEVTCFITGIKKMQRVQK